MFLSLKSGVLDAIKRYIKLVRTQTRHQFKRFHADNGSKFDNAATHQYFAENGICFMFTAPYSPSQNSIAERLNRTLVEKGCAMLLGKPRFLWAEAFAYSCYVKNHITTRALVGPETPHEQFWGEKPDVSDFHEFGIKCWVLNQGPGRKKLAAKSNEFMFTGISTSSKAWKYYDTAHRSIKKSRNVIFDLTPPAVVTAPVEGEMGLPPPPQAPPSASTSAASATVPPPIPPTPAPPSIPPPAPAPTITVTPPTPPSGEAPLDPAPAVAQAPPPPPVVVPPHTTCSSGRLPDEEHQRNLADKGRGRRTYLANERVFLGMEGEVTEPRMYPEAMWSKDVNFWKITMEIEIKTVLRTSTYVLVPLPPRRQSIGCKWVFKIKRDANGRPIKWKAWLVAQGFSQQPGLNFTIDGTFAPVVCMETLHILLLIAAVMGWEIHQVDIVGAYLHGDLENEIYMHQPEGFEQRGLNGEELVCKLQKSLYGLKQSGNVWNTRLHSFLISLGFRHLISDECVYISHNGADTLILVIYVDDIGVITSSLALIDWIKQCLHKEFTITNLGEMKSILGIEITRDRAAHTIKMAQPGYIRTIVSRFGQDSTLR